MKIAGLQKMTLLDYPGKVAATVFLSGCNFRCPYCHNASLVLGRGQAPAISQEDFFAFLQTRKGLLDGVCITGGEPLMQSALDPFFEKIKAMGFLLKLDTNGSYPEKLRSLVTGGLVDRVAMDIKNAPAKYAQTAGISSEAIVPRVQESVDYLLSAPVPYEFRTTVVKSLHTMEDMIAIGQWIAGAEQYFLQNFEDSGDILTPGLQGFTPVEMEAFADALRPYVPAVAVRNP